MAYSNPGFVSTGLIDQTLGQDEEEQQRAQFEAYQRYIDSLLPPEEQPPQDIYGPPAPDYGSDWAPSSDEPSGAYGNYMSHSPMQRWAGAGLPATNIETAPYMPYSPEAQFAQEQAGQGNYQPDFQGGQLGNLVPGVIPDNSQGPSMWGQTAANALNDVGAPQWSQDLGRNVADFLPFAVTGGFGSLPGLAAAGAGSYAGGEAYNQTGLPQPFGINPGSFAGMAAGPAALNAAPGVGAELADRWPQSVYHVPRDLESASMIDRYGLRPGTAVTTDPGIADAYRQSWSRATGEDLPVMEFRAAPRDLSPAGGYYQTNNRTLFPQTGETGSGPLPFGGRSSEEVNHLTNELMPSGVPNPTPPTTRAELRAALEAQGIDTKGMTPGRMEAKFNDLKTAQPEVTEPLVTDAELHGEPSATAGGSQPPEVPPIEPPTGGELPPSEPPPDAQEWLRANRERALGNAARTASPEPPKSINDLSNAAENSRYNKGLGVGGEAEPPAPSPLKRAFDELMSLPGMAQTIMAGGDVSAIGRQEAVLGAGNPARWKEAAAATLKAFGSPEAADAANEAVHQGKWYDFQKTAGVHEYEFGPGVNPAERVPGYTGISDSWLGRQMTKEWRIGGQQIPNPILAGERSFATGLNVEGFGVGEDYLQKMWDIAHANPKGFNDQIFERDAKALAQVINHGRGYGTGRVADVMSSTHAFFSGRNLVSKVQIVLDPFFQPGSIFEPSARQLAAKNLIGFASANAGLMGFLGLTGAASGGLWSVNPDPTAGDFGKLRIGNMRIDTMGGLEPLIRLVAREGDAIRQGDWAKVTPELTRFFANKGSPTVSTLRDTMVAADPGLKRYLGASGSFSGKAFALRFAPLMLQDMLEAYQQQGGGPMGFGSAALAGPADFVGLGVNTYQDQAQQPQPTFDPRFANPGTPSKARGIVGGTVPTATPLHRARY